MSTQVFYGTGRRKTSAARVRLTAGSGDVKVNGRSLEDYFARETLRLRSVEPLELTKSVGTTDVVVNVSGGGQTGQAEAIKHGISRALIAMNTELRPDLKRAGMLTRDARAKERKKYGQPGARKRFQFSKR